ncbi:MAG: hypothetical protein NC347_12265 [Clostridium sp.]|nr:hypothetical protein [Clostridium sp.]
MNSEIILKLNEIITRKSNDFGLKIMKPEHSGKVVSILREDWHLFLEMHNPIVSPLPLQMTIYIEDEVVRMLLFPSPAIIDSRSMNQFIQLTNTANRYLYMGSALGRFWVDVENCDLAYELILKEELLELSRATEIENQLFDIPYAHFNDLHIPLLMLAGNVWKADMAISYLKELRENGYVDNSVYGLW